MAINHVLWFKNESDRTTAEQFAARLLERPFVWARVTEGGGDGEEVADYARELEGLGCITRITDGSLWAMWTGRCSCTIPPPPVAPQKRSRGLLAVAR